MKKSYFKILSFILIVFIITLNNVYAYGDGLDENFLNQMQNGTVDTNVEKVVERVYGTIATIIKVVAVAGVMYTGVKYMMAGPGDKGAIKQSLIYLVIGTIFVFAADAIIGFVLDIGTDVIK